MTEGLALHPFRGLRYDPARVGDLSAVLCPPYDVIDPPAAHELAARHPYNAVRLVLPQAVGDPDPYRAAATRLAEWRHDGVLVVDGAPGLYAYEEAVDGHCQRGLVGALELVAPDAGIVLPHENTMAGPVEDRLALTAATEANLESIMLVYDGGGAASDIVAAVDADPPLCEATTADGVRHRVWAVTDVRVLTDVAADLVGRRAVIADGHHRYATYLRYQQERGQGRGSGPWDRGLAYLIDARAGGPQVHAIHRVVRGLAADDASARAERGFRVDPVQGGVEAALDRLADAASPAFVIGGGTRWWLLRDPDRTQLDAAMPPGRSPAWRALDVAVAHEYLIKHLWAWADTEDVVEYRHDVSAAVAAVRDGAATALLVNPTPLEAVIAVAAAGDRMPRKSTLFTPKPASGLLMRALADG